MADLKVRIIGTLNAGASINEINTAIKGIEKKVNKIKLNVTIDDNLSKNIEKLIKQLNNLSSIKPLRNQNPLGNMHTQAQQATKSVTDLGNAFQQAFTKFPIWMLSSTMFFAPIQAMDSMISRIIQIDTAMTDLRRVMDLPDYKFTELLYEAVDASDQLASKLTDVLSIMGDFGRMGFSDTQLVDITKTAQVLQNISDLDATAAVDTLTSAMLNFNISAQDSITIADKLNEVDNNFAISTKDLSDGIRRAASTARTFGKYLAA